jgi:Tfp pilus assembly protein PilO
MNSSWHIWKAVIGVTLGVLFVADLVLGGFLYWQSQQTPSQSYAQAQALKTQAMKLQADVQRGEKIRASLAGAGAECDKFYENTFLDSATGYSDVQADLSSIALKAGLHASTVSFKPKDYPGRGVTEITISESIEGDYPAILQFINGLEASTRFYLLRELTLDSASANSIRLKLELATYFRK